MNQAPSNRQAHEEFSLLIDSYKKWLTSSPLPSHHYFLAETNALKRSTPQKVKPKPRKQEAQPTQPPVSPSQNPIQPRAKSIIQQESESKGLFATEKETHLPKPEAPPNLEQFFQKEAPGMIVTKERGAVATPTIKDERQSETYAAVFYSLEDGDEEVYKRLARAIDAKLFPCVFSSINFNELYRIEETSPQLILLSPTLFNHLKGKIDRPLIPLLSAHHYETSPESKHKLWQELQQMARAWTEQS